MTQRKQIQWVSESPAEAAMIHRLAVNCQMLALEYGIDLTWKEAVARAQENLEHVQALAGGVR